METNKSKNVFLIGFMGCGKSTMARMLSRDTQMKLIEMDETIEAEEKMSINDMFEKFGEEYFRNLESELIQRISRKGNCVVSCGGGAILREDNVKHMKENGKIIYFSATPETIYKRVKHSTHRPLLNGNMNVEYITELMDKRLPLYEKAADEVICVDDKEKRQIVEELKKIVETMYLIDNKG